MTKNEAYRMGVQHARNFIEMIRKLAAGANLETRDIFLNKTKDVKDLMKYHQLVSSYNRGFTMKLMSDLQARAVELASKNTEPIDVGDAVSQSVLSLDKKQGTN